MASLREGQAESTICPADMTLTESPETTTSVKGESVASDSTESWSLGMPERTLQILYLPGFDILSVDESSWLGRGRDPTSTTSSPNPEAACASPTHCGEEPEQCPLIHSSVLVDPVTQAGQDEERSLEQMQTLVVEEVLKDIETACKLLNITPDPVDWNSGNVQKWLLWTEHLYKLPTVGQAFQQLDGKDLCAMSPEDFHKLCPEYGDTLHAHLDIWKSAAWMHGRCSVTDRPSTGGCQDAWPEADSSCSGQPVHLWQFLRELLLKPHNYSRYIRWLNKDKGIFKIEDSAQVARLWGQRKNRPAMNYDKLSRSIRQYYKKGIIRKPDMSQRLVYQFVNPV